MKLIYNIQTLSPLICTYKFCFIIISNKRKEMIMKFNNLKLNKLSSQWLCTIKNRVKITTYQKYEFIVLHHINIHLGEYKTNDITPVKIAEYSNKLLENLSPKTVNTILTVLHMIFNYANENYNLNLPKIKYVKETKKEMKVLSVTEQKALMTYLLNDIDIYKLAIFTLLFSGLRIGELCALEWNDIRNSTITVNKTIQRIKCDNKNHKTVLAVLPPKSDSSNRVVPIPDFLYKMLDKYRDGKYFLTGKNSSCIDPRYMQLKFKKYLEYCNIKNAGLHCLRHTFATRCIEAGWDIKSLSEVLGHSDVKITLNKYVHSSFEQKIECMNKLEMLLNIKAEV